MLQPLVIQAGSLEPVKVAIRATTAGLTVDPTADTVTMAFVAGGADPVGGDFKVADWETDISNPVAPVYYARCYVGPGGAVTLAKGNYAVYVKVVDSPEVPIKKAPARLVVE